MANLSQYDKAHKSYRRIGGLSFCPSKETRLRVKKSGCALYAGLESWVAAGSPDDSVVYDHAAALIDSGFPLLDTVTFNGVHLRTPVNDPKPADILSPEILAPAAVKLDTAALAVLNPTGVSVVVAEPKTISKSRMARGAGLRSKETNETKD